MCKIWFPKGGGDGAYQRGGTYQRNEIIRENATRSTLQKPVTGWMEALAITVHLTRKYFFA